MKIIRLCEWSQIITDDLVWLAQRIKATTMCVRICDMWKRRITNDVGAIRFPWISFDWLRNKTKRIKLVRFGWSIEQARWFAIKREPLNKQSASNFCDYCLHLIQQFFSTDHRRARWIKTMEKWNHCICTFNAVKRARFFVNVYLCIRVIMV